MKKDKGVITVFLALIFGILFTFFCTLIDITRINSAKNQLMVASDAAITSVLSQFDKDLYDKYGIMAFENKWELNKKIKEIMNENLPKSGLFNISLDKVSYYVGENPFTDTETMEKQMIYSMKYQGTENLVREVFKEIQQITGASGIIAENEKLQDIDEELEDKDLFEEIQEMVEGQQNGLLAVISLAKNNSYTNLSNNTIAYKDSISESELKKIYKNKLPIEIALNSKVEDYTPQAKLPVAYSYAYAKMILEMYKEGAILEENKPQETPPSTDDNSSTPVEENSTKKSEKINGLLKALSSTKYSQPINEIKTELKKYKKKIDKGKTAADDIVRKSSDYRSIIDKYKSIMNDDSSKLKDTAKDSYEYYDKLLKEAPEIQTSLNTIQQTLNRVLDTIDGSNGATSLLTKINKTLIENGKNQVNDRIYQIIDGQIGRYIENPSSTNIDDLVKIICNNSTILRECQMNSTVKNIQIDTTKGLVLGDSMQLDPPQDNKYKEFYDMFKKKKKEKAPSMYNVMKQYDSDGKLSVSSLPNKGAGSTFWEKFSTQVESLPDLSNIGNLGALLDSAGNIVDKIYLVEYIMTNFKDMVQPKTGERIPELTKVTDTELLYEIESIISGVSNKIPGHYSDQSSKTTLKDDFWTIRLALNTASLLMYQEKIGEFIDAVAFSIQAATQGVVPKPVARYIMIGAWATMETNYDVIDLYNGYDVPLLKTDFEQWYTNFGLDEYSFDTKDDTMNTIQSNLDMYKEDADKEDADEDAYNLQEHDASIAYGNIMLNYTDLLRFKLLITDQTTLIKRTQDLVVGNTNKQGSYIGFNTAIEIKVNDSNVNLLFNTPSFSSKGGKNKFNSFSFKRSYN